MRIHALFFIVFIASLSALVSGCLIEVNSDSDTIRGQGPLAQEFRNVGPISGVNLAMEGELIIEPGPELEFRVEVQQNLLRYINTYERNDVLVIEVDRDINLRPSEPIRFVLVAPELEEISITGSGDIYAGSFESRIFDISVAGSGDLFVDELVADRIDISIAGSGDIEIAGGTTGAQEISIAGSGDYEARALSSLTASVSIAGSGDGYIQVSDELTASLIGSGSVYYLGNPSVTSSTLGSGRVRALSN